jgi:hypothetical protein
MTRLVSIVGMNPLPAILACAALKPSECLLIFGSADWTVYQDIDCSRKELESFIRTQMNISTVAINLDSVDDPQLIMEQLRASAVLTDRLSGSHLDITGGTKPMVQEVSRRWRELNKDWSADSNIWYVETDTAVATVRPFLGSAQPVTFHARSMNAKLDQLMIAKLHGFELFPLPRPDPSKKGKKKKPGDELEIDVHDCLVGRLANDGWSVKGWVKRKQGNYGDEGWELDIFLSYGFLPVVIEVKSGAAEHAGDEARRVDALAKRFGGDNARGILVAPIVTATPEERSDAASIGCKIFDSTNLWSQGNGLVSYLQSLVR